MQPVVGLMFGYLKPCHSARYLDHAVSQLLCRQVCRTVPEISSVDVSKAPLHYATQGFSIAARPLTAAFLGGSNRHDGARSVLQAISSPVHKAPLHSTLPCSPSVIPQQQLSPIRTFNTGMWSSGRPLPFNLSFTNCVIAINAAAFLGQYLSKDYLTAKFMKSNWHIDNGEYWRLITPVFLHGDLWHLIINSYSLYNLGSSLEPATGLPRFATVYMLSTLAGNLFSYWYNHNNSVGASTALFGLLGADAMMSWRNRHVLSNSSANLSNIAVMIAINVAYGFSNPRIDNSGHFGGFVGGLIASYLLGPAYVRGRWGGYQDKPPIDIFAKRQ